MVAKNGRGDAAHVTSKLKKGFCSLRRWREVEIVKTPTQARSVLLYVLRNDVHHGLGLGRLDPCSSAPSFRGFLERQSGPEVRCVSVQAQTWILRVGWKEGGRKGGLSIHDSPRLTSGLEGGGF